MGNPPDSDLPSDDMAEEDLAESLDAGPTRKRGGFDADPGPDGPVRRCLATGERRPQAEMIRFVLGPDGTVTPDLAGKLPGRGMWLSADARSIKTASARKLFSKAARARVVVSDDLVAQVAGLLVRRCVETLSLARRAGEAVTGFEKVRAGLQRGDVAVLVAAADAAEDGRRKLAQALAAAQAAGKTRKPRSVMLLTGSEIGEAFGRERAVHVALTSGGLAEKLVRDAHRLSGFRPAAQDG